MREPNKIEYDRWTLAELLALTSTSEPTAWVPSLPIGEENDTEIVLAPDDYVAQVLYQRYGNRTILAAPDLTDAEAIQFISSLWSDWWDTREEAFAFLADAFLREYNPIENYDRYEEGEIVDTHDIGARSGTDNLTDTYAATQKTVTDTPGATKTVTDTPRAETTTTTTPGVKTTTERDVYGDNSSTAVPEDRVTVTPDATTPDVVTVAGTDGENTVVTAYEGFNQTVEAELQHIDTHNRTTGALAAQDKDTRTWDGYHVHGNIGVMTVSSMLASEVQVRAGTDLVEMAIREWVDRYTYYAD